MLNANKPFDGHKTYSSLLAFQAVVAIIVFSIVGIYT